MPGAVQIAGELGDRDHRFPHGEFFSRQQLPHFALARVEHQVGGQPGCGPAQEHQEHDPPGDHGIKGDGALQHGGIAVLMFQNLAAALHHPLPFFDPPAPNRPAHALEDLLRRGHLHGREQQPLDCGGVGGGFFSTTCTAHSRSGGRSRRCGVLGALSVTPWSRSSTWPARHGHQGSRRHSRPPRSRDDLPLQASNSATAAPTRLTRAAMSQRVHFRWRSRWRAQRPHRGEQRVRRFLRPADPQCLIAFTNSANA